jgi:hypothetical protein
MIFTISMILITVYCIYVYYLILTTKDK